MTHETPNEGGMQMADTVSQPGKPVNVFDPWLSAGDAELAPVMDVISSFRRERPSGKSSLGLLLARRLLLEAEGVLPTQTTPFERAHENSNLTNNSLSEQAVATLGSLATEF